MYIVKITNNTPLCKMVNFSRSVLKIYTGQKKFTRAAPVAPVTNIRYASADPTSRISYSSPPHSSTDTISVSSMIAESI